MENCLFTDTATVMAAARAIEPDCERRWEWFTSVPIHEFEGRTADDLVRAGETSRLIAMINRIRAYERQR